MGKGFTMTKHKSEKPYTIHFYSSLQNFTLGFKTLQEAIPRANELNRPVLDENKRVVYTPVQDERK